MKIITKTISNILQRISPVLLIESDLNVSLKTVEHVTCIFDVGVGKGTQYLYSRYPDASLMLFEPNPNYHSHIENNILNNRKGELFKNALGAKRCRETFSICGGMSSLFKRDQKLYGHNSATKTIEVEVRRLDELFNADQIPPGSLLKIDAEASELDILKGSESLLTKFDYIIVELRLKGFIDCYNPSQLVEFLAKHDFLLEEVLSAKKHLGQFVYLDALFVKKNNK